jgi:hypothetical protein
MKKENLLGQKFNRLLVLQEAPPIGQRKRIAWRCQCDCGIYKIVISESLKNGDTKSCGCLNKEQNKKSGKIMGENNTKYSPQESSARRVWKKRYQDGNILFEDFYRLSQLNCFYCDSPPNNIQNSAKMDKKASQFAKDNGDFIYNGLDRVDSSKTHSINNVVPCCKYCNWAKRERSIDDFYQWIEKVYQKIKEPPCGGPFNINY